MRALGFAVFVLIFTGLGMTSCCRACRPAKSQPVAAAQWALFELEGQSIDRQSADDQRFTIKFGPDGRVSGRGACNTFYSLENSAIDIPRVAATLKMCPAQELEDRYFRALENAATAWMDGDYMILRDSTDAIVASFRLTGSIEIDGEDIYRLKTARSPASSSQINILATVYPP